MPDRKIRSVVFVTYHFPPETGGPQTRISKYLDRFRRTGIAATVFNMVTRPAPVRETVFEGASVISCPGSLTHLPSNLARLAKEAIANRADVIHVFTGATTIFSISSLLLARLLTISAVFSFFGREGVEFKSAYEKVMFIQAATLATSIATNTNALKSLVPRKFQAKTQLLFGGADLVEPVDGTKKERSDRHEILSVSRLVESKGIDDVIEAFSIVKRAVPDSRLTIVGDGPQKARLMALAGSIGLGTEDVVFQGVLRGEALQEVYEACSVFVLASKQVRSDPATEAFGLVLIEASMHGKPLIGTRVGGIPEIVEDGVNGLLVPQGNPRRLAEAMITLLSEPGLREKMGANALEIARSRFTWEASAERLLRCYAA